MLDPANMKDPYEYLQNPDKILKFEEIPDYDLQDWDFNDEKEIDKYLKTCERVIRNSFEYRSMVNYLRDYIDMNKCSFYSNISNQDSYNIKIEIHHTPFSLYDIVCIVFRKRMYFHEDLDETMLAKEVMYLHYNLLVGLISVSETVHELIHNQFLFVPSSKVFGKYKEFVDLYKPWISPDQLDSLDRIEKISTEYDDLYKTILSKQFIYIDLSGSYELPKTEDLINMTKERINDLVNNTNSI